MDPTTHDQLPNEDNKSSTLCRQTTTRWTPTTEQIRILKDLYYNNGVRSPSADQIQKISAKLRQYGKIEGKNVFYWFQNHKARERQKKRLISTENIPTMHNRAAAAAAAAVWRPEDAFYNKCPNFTSGGAAGSSPGMIHGDGQFGKYGYGSLAMENGFWGGGHGGGGGIHNLAWTGVDPYHQYHPSAYNFLDKNNYFYDENTTQLIDEEEQEEEEEEEAGDSGLMETLPLFPIHGDQEVSAGFCKQESSNWYVQADGGSMSCSRASLELTLNSYGCMSPFSP